MSPSLELYWISGSPFAWRAQLVLSMHGIEYVSHRLEASKQEHKQPEYLELNPRGKVPTLRDGDFVLRESIAILAHLNAKHPQWQLFGDTPTQQGLIWQQICEVETQIAPLAIQLARPIFFGGLDKKRQDVLAAARLLHKEFKRLDETLATNPWLAGDRYSAADIVTYPLIRFLERAANKPDAADLDMNLFPLVPDSGDTSSAKPNLKDWVERFEELPGVRETYPPHWK